MNADLYKRLAALVREVNKKFGAGNCEVRPVVFGTPSQTRKLSLKSKEYQDIGPLGIFATRDIEAGEMVLVDPCLTAISNVPSSRFEHCDASHASLKMSWLLSSKIIKPLCCIAVAFCSRECYKKASNGYHTVVCGKDFDWLYADPGPEVSAGAGYTWQKIMCFRIISIILADQRAQVAKGEKTVHPVQHHLVMRMSANYAPLNKLHPNYQRLAVQRMPCFPHQDTHATRHRYLPKYTFLARNNPNNLLAHAKQCQPINHRSLPLHPQTHRLKSRLRIMPPL